MDTAGQPALQVLCKVANGLRQCRRNGTQNIGDEKVHNALVQDVVTGAQVVKNGLATRKQDQLFLWQVLPRFIFNSLIPTLSACTQ